MIESILTEHLWKWDSARHALGTIVPWYGINSEKDVGLGLYPSLPAWLMFAFNNNSSTSSHTTFGVVPFSENSEVQKND